MTDYHQPVLLQESVDGLNIKPDGIYVDATFGGGGHSREILSRLTTGKLLAFDQDADALHNIPESENFLFAHHNFRFLNKFLKYYGIDKIDGLLGDLGVSSHHFDVADRGFSFRFDADIDMRMNQNAAVTAQGILNEYSFKQLAEMFRVYGELKNAGKIAGEIVKYRQTNQITSSASFMEAVKGTTPRQGENTFLAKVYQAVRIEVNQEIQNLKELLEQTRDSLKVGGRLVIISYHSLEDRIAKEFIRDGTFEKDESIDLYGNKARVFKSINKKLIVPDEQELLDNNRSRSAKLRIAEKL
jgi:16S rRNA (cytosine1402-N4)-methyltransferase